MRSSSYRRRRVLWSLVLLTLLSLIVLATNGNRNAFGNWSLPTYLKDLGLSNSSSPARVVADANAAAGRTPRVREIDGLLYFVTAYPDRRLNEDDGEIEIPGMGRVKVDPAQEVDMRVYAVGEQGSWAERVSKLQSEHPLVVFSKSYCPYVPSHPNVHHSLKILHTMTIGDRYSQRAKALLNSYQLNPAPAVVELDLRSDGPIIQGILRRLTERGTVPNVVLKVSTCVPRCDCCTEAASPGQVHRRIR